MIYVIFVLLCCLGSTNSRSIFDDLPPDITNLMQNQSNNLLLFQPIGKFATNVHYMNINLSIYLYPAIHNNTTATELQEINKQIKNYVAQSLLNRLLPSTLSNAILLSIKDHIFHFAKLYSYESFVNHISDLFLIDASFVYIPNNFTLNILLHVPFVNPVFLLTLHQYTPFPLSLDFNDNLFLLPAVGSSNIMAVGNNSFQIVSQKELSTCPHLGDTYFCKGRNVLQTKMEETCLGAIFARHLPGIKSFCKLEQVFQIDQNKWHIFSRHHFTTAKVCNGSVVPLAIGYTTSIQLDPSCKVRLQSRILYAEQKDMGPMGPIQFTRSWNISAIYPTLSVSQLFTKPLFYVSLILGALAVTMGLHQLAQYYYKTKGKLVTPVHTQSITLCKGGEKYHDQIPVTL